MKYILLLFLIPLSFLSKSQGSYNVYINLNETSNDKIPVEITTPQPDQDQVEFHMAKIVPGTYSISDFGRFVSEFHALDSNGNDLPVEKLSTNRWQIKEARKLAKITYWIDDSFDNFENYGSNKLFEPGGTSIEAENEVFVINTFGFIGYLDGYKERPYSLSIAHHPALYGATSLKKEASGKELDKFVADNFNFLADAPILYCKPDTVSKNIAGANVLVSVYSPNKVLSANDVMENIDDLMEVQARYLGGKLPVDRYAYLIYLLDYQPISGAWGALEHSYSSLYSLPEMSPERINQVVRDVAAHEFFHILTPLNIHSEQIHTFNYIQPEMSQHLWLYEGSTEYASHHVQVKYGLYSIEEFLKNVAEKFSQSEDYGVDIAYTDFSANILEPENEARYGDVYAGGALMAMALDLTILNATDCELDLQKVMRLLAAEYGPNKAFKDAELFDEFERLTNEKVGSFLRNHIGDTIPIPYQSLLATAGIRLQEEAPVMVATTGKFSLNLNEDEQIFISDISEINDFGKDMGYQKGDILVEWNGHPVNLENVNKVLEDYYTNTKEKDKVTAMVMREGKKKKLKAKAVLVESIQPRELSVMENITPDQQKIREAWLQPDL